MPSKGEKEERQAAQEVSHASVGDAESRAAEVMAANGASSSAAAQRAEPSTTTKQPPAVGKASTAVPGEINEDQEEGSDWESDGETRPNDLTREELASVLGGDVKGLADDLKQALISTGQPVPDSDEEMQSKSTTRLGRKLSTMNIGNECRRADARHGT